MSDKKIVVPEEMLRAAFNETHPTTGQYAILRDGLEAAMRWLSENPIQPTHEQCRDMIDRSGLQGERVPGIDDRPRISTRQAKCLVVNWQRCMFLAPDPELPGEYLSRTRATPTRRRRAQ
jgi:hypothetical protein